MTSWPVAVTTLGTMETGSLLWTHQGELHVTVVLRTSHALGGAPLRPRPAAPGAHEARHSHDDRGRAVRPAADLAPRAPLAEIVHAGAVFAPAGVTMVRVAVARDGRTILDKRALASAK